MHCIFIIIIIIVIIIIIIIIIISSSSSSSSSSSRGALQRGEIMDVSRETPRLTYYNNYEYCTFQQKLSKQNARRVKETEANNNDNYIVYFTLSRLNQHTCTLAGGPARPPSASRRLQSAAGLRSGDRAFRESYGLVWFG